MAPIESKEFLEEFIACYRDLRVLWDTTNKNYQNKVKRSTAYEDLLAVMRKYKEDATVAEVKRKINTLRSTFRKELRKINESECMGHGANDIYQPTVWWFELMSFLSDLDMPMETSAIANEMSEIDQKCFVPEVVSVPAMMSVPPVMPIPPVASNPPLKKMKPTTKAELVPRKLLSNRHRSKKDDGKYMSIAKVWADKLKTLSYKRQLIVEKKINDIFFEEQMTDALSSEEGQGQQRQDSVLLLPSCTSSRYSSTDSFPSTSQRQLSPLSTSYNVPSQQFPTDAVELQNFYEPAIKIENLND